MLLQTTMSVKRARRMHGHVAMYAVGAIKDAVMHTLEDTHVAALHSIAGDLGLLCSQGLGTLTGWHSDGVSFHH